MITQAEAEKLLQNERETYVLDTVYTTAWSTEHYLLTRDKCDGHLAILMRRSDKEVLYACDHTKLGAKFVLNPLS